MADVIDFTKEKLERSPHIAGSAICLGCRHEWAVVAECGAIGFECPNCGLEKGVHKYLCRPENGTVWTCGCGNFYMLLTDKLNALCPNCGAFQRINPC